MKRKKELELVKKIIEEYYDDGSMGLFNTRNIAGDPMMTIFRGEYFTVDICLNYGYFEVFGTTDEEFRKLEDFYESIGSGINEC